MGYTYIFATAFFTYIIINKTQEIQLNSQNRMRSLEEHMSLSDQCGGVFRWLRRAGYVSLLQDCKDGSSELLSSAGVDDGIQAAVA